MIFRHIYSGYLSWELSGGILLGPRDTQADPDLSTWALKSYGENRCKCEKQEVTEHSEWGI